MYGAGRRRSGALKDVCAPVRHGAVKDASCIGKVRRWENIWQVFMTGRIYTIYLRTKTVTGHTENIGKRFF